MGTISRTNPQRPVLRMTPVEPDGDVLYRAAAAVLSSGNSIKCQIAAQVIDRQTGLTQKIAALRAVETRLLQLGEYQLSSSLFHKERALLEQVQAAIRSV